MKLTNLNDIGIAVEKKGIKFKNKIINYSVSDSDITGGRIIVSSKSNQLFTGRFEEEDVTDFVQIWSQYKNDKILYLKRQLMQKSDNMIKNYHMEVSPIEAMLYASNVISSSFSNYRLTEEIALVLLYIWKKNSNFLSSIEHIVKVWEWKHIINICAMAVGYICSAAKNKNEREASVNLMHYIFDRYGLEDQTRHGCFVGILETKLDEFIPDILNVIHDLLGNDLDKIIGNLFKKRFVMNFPGCYDQLNSEMFSDSSQYTRDLVRKLLLDWAQEGSFVSRYQNAKTQNERKQIIEEGLEKVKNRITYGIYDVIGMLKIAANSEISERMYKMLDLNSKNVKDMRPIISYFGYVTDSKANTAMKYIELENDYFASCQIALFRQNVISSDELMERFFTETRPRHLIDYLSGFAGLQDKISDVKNSTLQYFNKNLDDDKLRCAINNYEKLVRKYKHLYNPLVGEMFKDFFGFQTSMGEVHIRINEQNMCLGIIEMIIDASNYKKYEDFLYYVAEQGDFIPTIANHAREILRNINSDRIKL